MKSEDLQKMAYLYFCGEKDRELLWGKREMKYYDFRRLLFLINHIKFWDYGASFWNRFSGKFLKNIKALEAVYNEESENGVFYQDIEFSLLEEDNWIEDFIRNTPEDVREWLKVYVRNLDPEREELVDMLKCGMELENA